MNKLLIRCAIATALVSLCALMATQSGAVVPFESGTVTTCACE